MPVAAASHHGRCRPACCSAALNLSPVTAKASSRKLGGLGGSGRAGGNRARRHDGGVSSRGFPYLYGGRAGQAHRREWRVRRHRRSHRLRKIDPAQRRGRPAQARRRGGHHLRPAADRPQSRRRLSLPGRCAVSLEDRHRQCRHRPRNHRRAARGRAAARAGVPDIRRPRRLRQPLSAHAFRRPTETRGPRAGADPRSPRFS